MAPECWPSGYEAILHIQPRNQMTWRRGLIARRLRPMPARSRAADVLQKRRRGGATPRRGVYCEWRMANNTR